MAKQTTIRLTDEQKQALTDRFGGITAGVNVIAGVSMQMDDLMEFFEDPTSAITCLTEAFPAMIKRAWGEMRGKFTRGELMMIADVTNGTVGIVAGAGRSIGHNIAFSVEDSFDLYLGQYEEKWGVTRELVDKIQGLTSFQRLALEFWAFRFWVPEPHNTPEHDEKMLSLLGDVF